MSSRHVAVFASLLFVAVQLPAPTVGYLPPSASSYVSKNPAASAIFLIDASHPATGSGSLTTATVRWESAPASGCANAFKLKFVRPTLGGTFTVIAERGPFNVASGFVTNALTPPVDVVAG